MTHISPRTIGGRRWGHIEPRRLRKRGVPHRDHVESRRVQKWSVWYSARSRLRKSISANPTPPPAAPETVMPHMRSVMPHLGKSPVGPALPSTCTALFCFILLFLLFYFVSASFFECGRLDLFLTRSYGPGARVQAPGHSLTLIDCPNISYLMV